MKGEVIFLWVETQYEVKAHAEIYIANVHNSDKNHLCHEKFRETFPLTVGVWAEFTVCFRGWDLLITTNSSPSDEGAEGKHFMPPVPFSLRESCKYMSFGSSGLLKGKLEYVMVIHFTVWGSRSCGGVFQTEWVAQSLGKAPSKWECQVNW